MHTLAIRDGAHGVPRDGAEFVSHSCAPNTDLVSVCRDGERFVETDDASVVDAVILVANKEIEEGEAAAAAHPGSMSGSRDRQLRPRV